RVHPGHAAPSHSPWPVSPAPGVPVSGVPTSGAPPGWQASPARHTSPASTVSAVPDPRPGRPDRTNDRPPADHATREHPPPSPARARTYATTVTPRTPVTTAGKAAAAPPEPGDGGERPPHPRYARDCAPRPAIGPPFGWANAAGKW